MTAVGTMLGWLAGVAIAVAIGMLLEGEPGIVDILLGFGLSAWGAMAGRVAYRE